MFTRRKQRGGGKVNPSMMPKSKGLREGAKPSKGLTLGAKHSKASKHSRMWQVKSKRRRFKLSSFLPRGKVGSKLQLSIKALTALLNIYMHSSRATTKSRENIYEFLVIVNSNMRKAAADNEGFLRLLNFSGISNITNTSIITLENVNTKTYQCISLLNALNKKLASYMEDEYKRDLDGLVAIFGDIVTQSIHEAKKIKAARKGDKNMGGNDDDELTALFGGMGLGGLKNEKVSSSPAPRAASVAAPAASAALGAPANNKMDSSAEKRGGKEEQNALNALTTLMKGLGV